MGLVGVFGPTSSSPLAGWPVISVKATEIAIDCNANEAACGKGYGYHQQ
jgi:hypothetical protein